MTEREQSVLAKLAQDLGELIGRFDAAREADDKRWADMDRKVDSMCATLEGVPCLVDDKISACRKDREAVTKDAVEDANRRHVLSAVASDWRTWLAFIGASAGVLIGFIR